MTDSLNVEPFSSEITFFPSGGPGYSLLLDGLGEDVVLDGRGIPKDGILLDFTTVLQVEFEAPRTLITLDQWCIDLSPDEPLQGADATAQKVFFGLLDQINIWADNGVPFESTLVTYFLAGPDVLSVDGTFSKDFILTAAADAVIRAGRHDDDVEAAGAGTTAFLGSGNDSFRGYDGAVTVFGNRGHDNIEGSSVGDMLDGGTGDDTVIGQLGDDFLFGRAGDDLLVTGAGNNSAYGGDGDDVIDVGLNFAEADIAANNILSGNDGRDLINGGEGSDVIRGGDGSDFLRGLSGQDWLTGDAGADIFEFVTEPRDHDAEGHINRTVIRDFDGAEDYIRIAPSQNGSYDQATLDQLWADNARQSGNDVVFSLDGTILVVRDTQLSEITSDHLLADVGNIFDFWDGL